MRGKNSGRQRKWERKNRVLPLDHFERDLQILEECHGVIVKQRGLILSWILSWIVCRSVGGSPAQQRTTIRSALLLLPTAQIGSLQARVFQVGHQTCESATIPDS